MKKKIIVFSFLAFTLFILEKSKASADPVICPGSGTKCNIITPSGSVLSEKGKDKSAVEL